MEREHQHAEVTVRVSLPVSVDADVEYRKRLITDAVSDALDDGIAANHGVYQTELQATETPGEAAERQMAEAESEYLAQQERRAERHFEERGGWW